MGMQWKIVDKIKERLFPSSFWEKELFIILPLHCVTGVLQASGTDITSTDELVMVLTDHDYQEGHEGENADNSNIVVLYSHPVDGQQGQFITSQVSIGGFVSYPKLIR